MASISFWKVRPCADENVAVSRAAPNTSANRLSTQYPPSGTCCTGSCSSRWRYSV